MGPLQASLGTASGVYLTARERATLRRAAGLAPKGVYSTRLGA
jgi:hypothetical protein